jgi:shikimate kinase
MSYFIIIRGPLGVGKSTIARKLADILKGEYISIDEVLEKHNLDKIDKKEGGIPAKNFIKGNEIVLPKVREKLSKGKVVILDGCFYHKEQIEHFIQNLDASYYVFTLKAPLDICIERDSKRKKVYGKEATIAVHNMVSRFDYGTVINTENKNVDQTADEILSYLPKHF